MQTRPVVATPATGAPSFAQRSRGLADRAAYSEAAGEAGALSAGAPNVVADQMAYAQNIRQNAIQSAGAQTDRHYEIRRNMANDATSQAVATDNSIRSWAEMALQGKFKNRELGMEQQRIDNEAQYRQDQTDVDYEQLGLQDKERLDRKSYNKGQLGLQDRELQSREKYQTAQVDQEARRLGLQDREMQGRERLGMLGDYTPESVKQYEKTGDIATLKPRGDKTASTWKPGNSPGVYKSMLEQQGYDSSQLYDAQGNPTAKGQDFQDTLDFLYSQGGMRDDPGALAQAAAGQIGLQKTPAPTGLSDKPERESAYPYRAGTDAQMQEWGGSTPLPKGIPRGSKLLERDGDRQTWETPDGKIFQYTPG